MLDPWTRTKLTHSFFQTNRNKYLASKERERKIPLKLKYLFDPGAEVSCLYNFLSLNCRTDTIENILRTGSKKYELQRPEDLAALELLSRVPRAKLCLPARTGQCGEPKGGC